MLLLRFRIYHGGGVGGCFFSFLFIYIFMKYKYQNIRILVVFVRARSSLPPLYPTPSPKKINKSIKAYQNQSIKTHDEAASALVFFFFFFCFLSLRRSFFYNKNNDDDDDYYVSILIKTSINHQLGLAEMVMCVCGEFGRQEIIIISLLLFLRFYLKIFSLVFLLLLLYYIVILFIFTTKNSLSLYCFYMCFSKQIIKSDVYIVFKNSFKK